MSMTCPCCERRFDANEGDVLVNLPDCAADEHPVETQCAFDDCESHLSRSAADVFSTTTLTHGNGELCSEMLHNSLDGDCMRRVKSCHSKAKQTNAKNVANCTPKDGVCIKTHPPASETMTCLMTHLPAGAILGD